MSKFLCRCGHVMDLSEGWSQWELAILPEKTIEEIGTLHEKQHVTVDDFYKAIDLAKLAAYKCPVCGRLYVESDVKSKDFISYVRE